VRVLVTEPIVDDAIHKLEKHFDVTVGNRGEFDEEQRLMKAAAEFDAILTMLSNPVTENVLATGKKNRLRIVANYAVGFNNIDTDAAARLGIHISNTPDVLTESTAEIALSLLLSTARRTREAERYLRNGKFKGWEPNGFIGIELYGSTVGIVGLGRIGQAFARRAKACGMKILYYGRNKVDSEIENELDATYYSSLHDILSDVDALSIHCPLTEDTHHLIGSEELSLLPSHAVIVNTARGPIIDESALAEALHQSSIGGAGLDVFENEPEVHPRLLEAPNTVLLPHIGSATNKSRIAMGNLAADAIISILNGNSAPNLVV
jgi:glyoxylate reductase